MQRKLAGYTMVALATLSACADVAMDMPQVATRSGALTSASADLVGIGKLSGSLADKSATTASLLENGLPGNLLGGVGSGLAYAGGNTFLALPDRGPNATHYNSQVDDTSSYVPRFHTLKLKLAAAAAGASLPLRVTPELARTTLFHSRQLLVYGTGGLSGLPAGAPAINDKRHFYFSGRSDNFDSAALSTSPRDGRFDPESVRVSADGERLYVSDEYGPYVYEFERETGRRLRSFTLPAEFAVQTLSSQGDAEISGNAAGRVANKGMEGLAITPDGKTLVGVMQSPLLQDGGTAGKYTRIVEIDLTSGSVSQYAYELTNIGTAKKPKYATVSDILAVNSHELLVDERDGKGLGDGSEAAFKHIFRVDLASAVDVSGLAGETNLVGMAVPKQDFLDVVAVLNAHGIKSADVPAKLEGLAFGRDVRISGVAKHTLVLANDNDFLSTITDSLHPTGIDNPNQFFVFGFTDADLPGYTPQILNKHEDD
jgi:hypothetical protein